MSSKLFSMKRYAFLALLWCAGTRELRAKTYASPPIRLSVVSSVRISPEVFRFGTRLRIRNLSSGNSLIVDISPEQPYLPAGTLSRLVTSPEQQWLPEFSVLGDLGGPTVGPVADLPPALRVKRDLPVTEVRPMSPAGNPSWRVLGYRVIKSPTGLLYLEVSDGVKTVFVTPEQAARRVELRENGTLKKLFELGWRSLSIQRYDLGLEAFQDIFKRGGRLDEKQNAQAHLGLAISRYHLEGCSKALEDQLVEADRDPANQDDVSYYRALCEMADEDYGQAEILFKRLVTKQNLAYSEPSAFYLGIIAEADERFADAEAAYLDTIDFASDASLVSVAKARLENVREVRSRESLDSKWISGGLSFSGTYDTNIVVLPPDISPALYGLSKTSSLLTSDIAFLSLAPPWSRSFTHKIDYSFLLNHNFDAAIAKSYDSHLHEIGTDIAFRSSETWAHDFGYGWNSVSLGPLGSAKEVLRTQTAAYSTKLLGGKNPAAPDWDLEWRYRFMTIRPSATASTGSTDLTGSANLFGLKFLRRSHAPHVYGPEVSIERRTAAGIRNRLWDFRFATEWDYVFGVKKRTWSVAQNFAFSYKPYATIEGSPSRRDYALLYSGSIGRTWGDAIDTRLQLSGIYNFSTLKLAYQYHQASLTLLVTALF